MKLSLAAFPFAALSALFLPALADAAVVAATNNLTGPDPAASWVNPYAVSSSDLINGATPVSSVGDFALESGGGLPVLTDGEYGTITRVPGVTPEPHPAFATAGNGNGSGSSLVYSLGANPLGYNLTNITVFGGWNDAGRDQQSYVLAYSTVADPGTFIDLITVNFNPAIAGGLQSATRIMITEDTLPFLAENAGQVRFTFGAPVSVENGHAGYAEIDVFGVPVPEPSAFLLGGAGLLLLLRRRRA